MRGAPAVEKGMLLTCGCALAASTGSMAFRGRYRCHEASVAPTGSFGTSTQHPCGMIRTTGVRTSR